MSNGSVDIRGRKVRLRDFAEADIDDRYVAWLNDPVVTRFSNQRFSTHSKVSCLRYFASFERTPNRFLSVRRLADDVPIGTMTIYFSPQHGTADVGILIGDRSIWGEGYGQDAWDTVMAWLLARPEVRKVTAGTLALNAGMIRLAERSGMVLEGRRLRQEIVKAQEVDILYFGRFRNNAHDRMGLPPESEVIKQR